MVQDDFILYSAQLVFAPFFVPNRFVVNKERELNREGSFCGGEDVSDTGSKNREIHISGPILSREVNTFHLLLDNHNPFELISPGWSGEVRVHTGELEGPTTYDPVHQQYRYRFTLDLVSTGEDESGDTPAYGIISTGTDL